MDITSAMLVVSHHDFPHHHHHGHDRLDRRHLGGGEYCLCNALERLYFQACGDYCHDGHAANKAFIFQVSAAQ